MLPPTLASRGGSGLSLSPLRPFLFGLRELAAEDTHTRVRHTTHTTTHYNGGPVGRCCCTRCCCTRCCRC